MTASPLSASRFQIVERPFASPGKCAGCGCVDRPVVDTRVDIEFYGVIYFCLSCLEEIATTIDMVPKRVLQFAEEAATQSFNSYVEKNNLKVITREQYELSVSALLNLRNAFDASDVSNVAEADEADESTDSEEPRTESVSGNNADEKPRQDNRSPRNKRSASVSADNGDGANLFNLD